MTIDDVLDDIAPRLGLEADAEHELLEEIRGHLEEWVAAAKLQGLDEQRALREAAGAFGVDQAILELHQTHAGWGTREALAAAALPVVCALGLRWLIFAPDGTADAWRELLTRPTFWLIAAVALLVPVLRFPRRRYALALWLVFWGLSLITSVLPAFRY